MSDAEWDADDFEPDLNKKVVPAAAATDKWDGEDEEDSGKEDWEKDDNQENGDQPKAVQRKKKKKLADILAEKEAAKEAELEARANELAAKKMANTPEGRAIEKMRLLKMEESVNIQMAKDMAGIKTSSIDGMVPVAKDEFEAFEKALTEKIQIFATSEYYTGFLESLFKNLSLDLNAATLKKIKMNTEALHSAKLKEEKSKNKKKPAGKGGIKMDLSKDMYANAGGGGYDDMDDFM